MGFNLKWTVLGQSERSMGSNWTVFLQSFSDPLNFLGHPLSLLKFFRLFTFGPLIFIHLNRSVLLYKILEPSTFTLRLIRTVNSAQKTVHYRHGPSTITQMTARFGSRPFTFGCYVQFRMTVHFEPDSLDNFQIDTL